MKEQLLERSIGELLELYPYGEDFFLSAGLSVSKECRSERLKAYFQALPQEQLEDIGATAERLCEDFVLFIGKMEQLKKKRRTIDSITIRGGKNKIGHEENIEIIIEKGSIVSIVGPTGSGKSCLLADIECLAQRDTQTGRQILINGRVPDRKERFGLENKLIAQLTQNMNFVMDLPVGEFLKLHGESRMIRNLDEVCTAILEDANRLAGEPFTAATPLTQLSGGQSRALMIADTALLSTSPIILIDEIENAGVDRKRALELLVKKGKIVFLSTHDPILALMAERRLIIENGGIKKVLTTAAKEQENLKILEKLDHYMLSVRDRMRAGAALDFEPAVRFIQEEEL